jgi:predicted enzyme related to lactoylglutathione lyase
MADRSDLPVPTTGVIATHFVVARDIETTVRFYSEVLGGEVVWRAMQPGAPTYVKFSNIWIGVNASGGPTPDKPEIVLDVHDEPNRYDTFLNLRVADIQAVYDEWRERGAEFLTPPSTTKAMSCGATCGTPTAASSRLAKRRAFSKTSGIERIGATGFEPATFRPPADRLRVSMRP